MLLLARVFLELVRYELAFKRGGFRKVYASVRHTEIPQATSDPELVSSVCGAVALAACFYWKPVLCLQRAVVTTKLLRKRGVRADMVIGYRPSPFFSHAWVEV